MLFTEPTFLFLFLPVLLALYFLPAMPRIVRTRHPARRLRQLAAAHRVGHLLRERRRRLHVADARLDRLQLLDGDCRRPRAGAVGDARTRRWSASRSRVNLIVLGVFKYANFFVDNVNAS